MDGLYKRSKFQLNRMNSRRVIRGQSFRHSLPTLDCKFEPNATFTDRDETVARQKVWGQVPKISYRPFSTKDSLGPSAQNLERPCTFKTYKPYMLFIARFRFMAPESLIFANV